MITYERTVDYDKNGNANKVTVTEGVGTTLYITLESERIMSDVWETVTKAYYWNRESKSLKSTWVDNAAVVVDADFAALESEMYDAFFAKEHDNAFRAAEDDSFLTAVRGREVIVTGGRDKSLMGKSGKVAVVKEMVYGMGYRSALRPKLGIALDDEKVMVERNGRVYENYKNMIWVWAHNCEVVSPAITDADLENVKRLAESRAKSTLEAIRDRCNHSIKTMNYKEAA